MGVRMSVMVRMPVGGMMLQVSGSHDPLLYYNITSVHQTAV